MIDLLEVVTPSIHAGTPFRAHRETQPFRVWAEQHAATCLRRFSIRYLGDFAPATVSNMVVEETSDTFEVVIAYPTSGRFGADIMTSLDDAVFSDQVQVHAAIGPPGYQSLEAQATVISEEGWTREEGDQVTFAVIRYRVDFYRATQATPSDVTVTGTDGVALSAGTILRKSVDGEDALRALVFQNGLFKVTYEDLGGEPCVLHVYMKRDGAWVHIVDNTYGDNVFVLAPLAVAWDEIEIIEASGDAVEIAFRMNEHALNVPYLGSFGITNRDQDNNANYQSNGVVKAWTVCKATYLVRMERGLAGYFRSIHTEPRIAPAMKLLTGPGAIRNNESDYGERELWIGFGSAVAWSSNPEAGVARFPAWGDKAEWDAAELIIGDIPNHTFWHGIDDATYGAMANAAYAQTQNNPSGFPRQQLTGPWYFADIAADSIVANVCRYNVQQMPLESGTWQFGSQRGTSSNHFSHSWPDEAGLPMRFQTFFGAFSYAADTSDGYANEPRDAVRAEVSRLVGALVWPQWPIEGD